MELLEHIIIVVKMIYMFLGMKQVYELQVGIIIVSVESIPLLITVKQKLLTQAQTLLLPYK